MFLRYAYHIIKVFGTMSIVIKARLEHRSYLMELLQTYAQHAQTRFPNMHYMTLISNDYDIKHNFQ